jgi:FkbM family methyltransferase
MSMSWTVDFVRTWWGIVDLPSVLALRDHAIRSDAEKLNPAAYLNLRLRKPSHPVFLREQGSDFRMFDDIFRERVYEKALASMNRCETCIDLGGNIGLTSLLVARRFPKSRVFTVEADKSNFELMNRNLAGLIEAGRCKTIWAAAWHEDTDKGLNTVSSGPGRFMNVRVEESAAADDPMKNVRGVSMKTIFADAGFDRVDFLKIDIEGAERNIFRDGAPWLDRVGAVAIEFHQESRKETKFDEIMTRAGFRILPNVGESRVAQHTVVAVKA